MQNDASVVNVSRAIYIGPLKWKVGILSAAILLFASNVSTLAQNSNIDMGFNEQDGSDNAEYQLSDNGFISKPSLVSTEDGERIAMSDALRYTVNAGDTISYIAARFNVSTGTILNTNKLPSGAVLRPGQTLIILPVDGLLHDVKEGDSLEKIAKKYGVDESAIIVQNNLENKDISSLKSIIVPGAKPIQLIAENKTVSSKARYASLNLGSTSKLSISPPAGNNSVQSTITGCKGFGWPVEGGGRISQGSRRGHIALDVSYKSKSDLHPYILAVAGGKVIRAATSGYNGGYGNVIVLDHGNGFKTLYAHNQSVLVSVGDYVAPGTRIAVMGNSGRVYGSTGIHVHYEVMIDGKKTNPSLCY